MPNDAQRGVNSPAWRGDSASSRAKHRRAQRLFPKLGKCERCQNAATDRHHKDGNPGNNRLDNIQLLCRKCHFAVDGRLSNLIRLRRERAKAHVPSKPCVNCRRKYKPLRMKRCRPCYRHWRAFGSELPKQKWNNRKDSGFRRYAASPRSSRGKTKLMPVNEIM